MKRRTPRGGFAPGQEPLPDPGLAARTRAEKKNSSGQKARKNFSEFKFQIIDDDPPPSTSQAKGTRITPNAEHLQTEERESRWESPRVRAAKLRARMLQFNRIYNAAWHVRSAQHGREEHRREKVEKFMAILRRELENCKDPEALLFAIADSITSFPRGAPWED